MSESKGISLRPKALDDLEKIYNYSVSEFGVARAEEYIFGLNDAFSRLAKEPHIAKVYSNVRSDLMGFTVISHIIFFKYTKNQLIVIRVLHQSMDYIRHL